jgi:hypothetical protein
MVSPTTPLTSTDVSALNEIEQLAITLESMEHLDAALEKLNPMECILGGTSVSRVERLLILLGAALAGPLNDDAQLILLRGLVKEIRARQRLEFLLANAKTEINELRHRAYRPNYVETVKFGSKHLRLELNRQISGLRGTVHQREKSNEELYQLLDRQHDDNQALLVKTRQENLKETNGLRQELAQARNSAIRKDEFLPYTHEIERLNQVVSSLKKDKTVLEDRLKLMLQIWSS